MKTYTVDGYTFTEEQLLGENPYANSEGGCKEGFEFEFYAFGGAQFQYELGQMTEPERKERLRIAKHLQDKMNS